MNSTSKNAFVSTNGHDKQGITVESLIDDYSQINSKQYNKAETERTIDIEEPNHFRSKCDRHMRSLSPKNFESSTHRTKNAPDRERMLFLAQPKKLLKHKRKRKNKKTIIQESLVLPNIKSPNTVKHSLLNIAKAKIYGVDVDKFPFLIQQKEKYKEYKKKLKHYKDGSKKVKNKVRTSNNSPVANDRNENIEGKKLTENMTLPNISVSQQNIDQDQPEPEK